MKRSLFARILPKRALTLVLACFLVLGLCACGNDADGVISNDTAADGTQDTATGSVDDTADKKDEGSAEPEDGEAEKELPSEETFFLNSPAMNIRVFGEREYTDGIFISCNYPGSGFESKLKCNGGAVTVKLLADGECSFLVYVDGALKKNSDGGELFAAKDGLLSIGEVAEGEHTLRVIRATGYGEQVRLYAISLAGAALSDDSYSEERTFIEFIGDGINSTVGNATLKENVAATYPYLVAERLNADYSITAYNDKGLVSTRVPITELYGSEGSGDYTRKASVAVINVGEKDINGGTVDMSLFRSRYEELARKVKEINGSECRVLMICTSGDGSFKDAVSAVCDSLGGANSGYFVKVLSASTGAPHTEAEHAAYASEIISAIEEVKDFKVQALSPEQSGIGNEISYDSAKWGTL